jgi:ATP-dependent Clp protease ATP-binding subunit ClpB
MTSNLGSDTLAALEERQDLSEEERGLALERAMNETLRAHFRPEFLNRIDETLIFRRLSRDNIRQIVDVQLGRIEERLATRNLRIQVTSAAKDWLAEVGFDPEYGARPLKRALQRYLEDELARRVIGGEVGPGDLVRVDCGVGRLSFERVVQD